METNSEATVLVLWISLPLRKKKENRGKQSGEELGVPGWLGQWSVQLLILGYRFECHIEYRDNLKIKSISK